jgi:hypothetical protein
MSATYPLWKQELQKGTANTPLGGSAVVKIVGLTSSYTRSAAHQFLSDLTSGARVGTPQTLGSKVFSVSGQNAKFTSAGVTFTAVATGSTIVAVAIWVDTGTESTSPLVAYLDGISVVTNGGDVGINPDATAGWLSL